MTNLPTRTAKSARARKLLALLGVVATVFGAGIYGAASAAPAVPAPTITSAPANPTNSTSATFTFSSDPPSGISYQCSLDGAAFAACSSPKSYSALGAGSHSFRVRAKKPSGELSTATSHSWVIDRTPPPPPAITSKPASLSTDTSPSFSFTDAEPGASFRCALDNGSFVSCSSPRSYSLVSQGAHTFQVQAVDAAGNTSAAVAYAWTLDSVAPPMPKIEDGPDHVTKASGATFAFTHREAPVTFECKLDGGDWVSCTSPVTYLHLTAGKHEFAVRALDAAGNASNDIRYSWKVTLEAPRNFSISGNATGLLYPGAPPNEIAVKLTNPSSDPIYVTALQVSVTNSSSAGCPASTNIAVGQAGISEQSYVLVPGNGSVTLPAQGVAAPTIRLLNLPVNQDACKHASFTFSYSGSAHS